MMEIPQNIGSLLFDQTIFEGVAALFGAPYFTKRFISTTPTTYLTEIPPIILYSFFDYDCLLPYGEYHTCKAIDWTILKELLFFYSNDERI